LAPETKNLIIVLGPTGVGKSSTAVNLALAFNGEIINCDSLQVYRGFDIGTDKPLPEERKGVPHHLLDIADPDTQFTAADFVREALKAAGLIFGRSRIPIVVGGTGLYFKAFLEGLFPGPGRSVALRDELENEIHSQGLETLWRRLELVDPAYARKIGKNDRIRIIRALEVHSLTGKPLSEHFCRTTSPLEGFPVIKIGLQLERKELYERIEKRVDRMFERGLIREVEGLLRQGVKETAPPFRGLGYKSVLRSIRKEITPDEAVALTKTETRHYAKRQMTWFKKMKGIAWFSPADFSQIVAHIQSQRHES
jgi:tRNA dimethylallyltransferase